MEIKEAVDTINELDTVRAVLSNGEIEISDVQATEDDWFLQVSTRGESLDEVSTDYYAIVELSARDFMRIFDVLKELLDTPVKDRFPEKRYYVKVDRGFPWPHYVKSMINCANKTVVNVTNDKSEAATFTKPQLESYHYSIELEPVEDDE